MIQSAVPSTRQQRTWPEDYHAYVFQDGKLVGDFENMYRHAKEVPWYQDQRCHHWSAEVGMLMLKAYRPYASILEVGCGLGFITAKLQSFGRKGPVVLEAFDVSPTAIRRARRLHAGIEFYVDDITKTSFQPRQLYDLVVVRELFWYVFPHLDVVTTNLRACLNPTGLLYIGQSFPALDRPFVGKDILPTPEALLGHVSEYEPLHVALLRNHNLVDDGPILHFLGRKRK